MSLKKKAVSGLFWTFSQQFSVQIINFVVQIFLARILMPSDFGLIAMLAVFMSVGTTLMDSGLTSSLIRTENPDQKDYSTVFFMNLAGSLLVYLVLVIASPFIADFYKQPVLENIIKIYTLSFFVKAFVGVQTTRLTKAMNFKLQMTMQIPSVIVGGIVGIVMAYNGFGVWSLVYMNLVQTILFTAQHWIFSGWRPSLIFDLEKFKYHFFFGYKLTLSSLLNTVYQNLYNLIIGKYFSASQLGFYNRADTLRMFPVNSISNALNKVTYPMFSSIQNDNKRLKMAYKKLMQQVLFWLAPLLVFSAVLGEPLIRFVLTDKWLPAVPYFQLLCFGGILYPLHSYNLNILKVKGRSDLFLKLEVIKKAFITVGIIISVQYGIYGLLYFQMISSLLSFYVNTFYSGKLLNYSMKEQLLDIMPILLISFVLGFLMIYFNDFITKRIFSSDFMILAVSGLVYFSTYFIVSFLLKISAVFDFKQLVLKR